MTTSIKAKDKQGVTLVKCQICLYYSNLLSHGSLSQIQKNRVIISYISNGFTLTDLLFMIIELLRCLNRTVLLQELSLQVLNL